MAAAPLSMMATEVKSLTGKTQQSSTEEGKRERREEGIKDAKGWTVMAA